MPQISVIVPVYNVEPFIHRCVDSILAQSFSDFELILVDDGSPDNCGAICDEYANRDKRIHVIHQKNGGLSAARNAGIDWALTKSDSEWISFIDSDDWVHINYLEYLFHASVKTKSEASCCLYTRVLPDGEILDNPVFEREIDIITVDEYFSKTGMGYTPYTAWAKIIKKEFFDTIRFPVGKNNEDLFTTHKLLVKCESIARVNSVLYYYFQSDQSIMRSRWTPKRLDEVEASEKLIVFMNKHKYKESKNTALKRYLWVLETQIQQMQELENPSTLNYEKRLLKKVRYLLIFHYKRVLTIEKRDRYFEKYFPKINWLRWTLIGINNKIKRVLNKNA